MTAPAGRKRYEAKKLPPDELARLRAQVGLPPEGPTPDEEPEDETATLRAALEDADRRRQDLAAELRRHVDAQERRAVRAEHERDQYRRQVANLQQWNGNLANQVETLRTAAETFERERDEAAAQRDGWKRECNLAYDESAKLRGDLEETGARLAELEAEVTTVVRTAQELTATTGHRHAWEWQPALKPMPLPCSCGRPWPRPGPPDLAVVPHRKPKGSTR